MSTYLRKKNKQTNSKSRRFSQNPFFYFGVISFILFSFLFNYSDSLAKPNSFGADTPVLFNSFFKNTENLTSSDLFFSQNKELALETPDLNIMDNSLAAKTTPSVLTTQTLGDIFGGSSEETRTDVQDYEVQPGDTIQSVAARFNITAATVAQANGISTTTPLKIGDVLAILPVSGILHVVKDGDTIEQIASKYKVKAENILAYAYNDPVLYVGQSLPVPGAVITPQVKAPVINNARSILTPLPDSLFIFPLLKFRITQTLHPSNGVDLGSDCGDPVYAVASGVVEKAAFNRASGNYVVIAHENGARTYSGHLSSFKVRAGDKVTIGDQIGSEGKTGAATGCHVHFQVMGGFKNPLAGYPLGSSFVNGNLVK